MIEMDIEKAREIAAKGDYDFAAGNCMDVFNYVKAKGYVAGYEAHRESKELKDLVEAAKELRKDAKAFADDTALPCDSELLSILMIDKALKPFLNTRQDDEAGEV